MRPISRAAVSLVAFAVASAPLAVVTPATAASRTATAGTSAAAVAPCLTNVATRLIEPSDPPDWRHLDDTGSVTKTDLAALPRAETRPALVKRSVEPRLADVVRIPVYAHVIKGRHKGERRGVSGPRVRKLVRILNNGMAGLQSSLSVNTRYRFTLKRIDRTRRDGWYHAFFNGPRDRKMKRKLHRGNARSLNLYLNGGGPRNNPVLGWARFPWQYASAPRLDGVSVNVAAMPGGKATYYNLGDTVIHETGHWLGLFHTFQNGCDSPGDLVADTAAEGVPSLYCETTRDSCLEDPGTDPVRNFMDYSRDACMNMFTDGQVRRMDAAFEKWRS